MRNLSMMPTRLAGSSLHVFLTLLGLASLAAGVTYVQWALSGVALPVISPDSITYRSFSNAVPPGYPIFLWGLRLFSLAETWAVFLQLALAVVASASLGWVIWHGSRRVWPGVMLLLLSWGNPYFTDLHAAILTDSFFASFLALLVVFLYMFFSTGRRVFLLSAAACIGLMVSLRPPGYVILLGVAVMLFWRDFKLAGVKKISGLILFVFVAVVPVIIGGYIKWSYHHGAVTSHTGQMALIRGIAAAQTIPHSLPPAANAAVKTMRERIGPFIEDAKQLGLWEENRCLSNAINALHNQSARLPGLHAFLQEEAASRNITVNEVKLRMAADLLLENPWTYIRQSLVLYSGLWLNLDKPLNMARLNAFLIDHRPLPQFVPEEIYPEFSIARRAAGLLFSILAWAIFLSGLVLLFPIRLLRPATGHWAESALLQVLIMSAYLLHLSFAFIAFSNIAIPRYYLDYWPVLLFMPLGLLSYFQNHRRAGFWNRN